jgi:hydrogenase maturation protein HypF
VETQPFTWAHVPEDFTIRHSAGGAMDTQIVPDAATCPACLAEMRDPRAPLSLSVYQLHPLRAAVYHYPRHALRPSGHGNGAFPLCRRVKEYRNPADRRFHAQPVACPDCGPALEWRAGDITAEREAALRAAVAMLKSGGIVAVKGLGGFHLVCDARNPQAVATLRARKQRPSKPLAVMIPHADDLPEAVQALLRSPAAPIVLTPKAWLPALPKVLRPGWIVWASCFLRIRCSIF